MATKKDKKDNLKKPLSNEKNEKRKNLQLPENIFKKEADLDLISQVARALEKRSHPSASHAKDRSEKRGGGAKPWRQKGTGRARHGSIRSPIWRGGGVTHGPRKERKNSYKVNNKVKNKALAMVLSKKLRDEEMFFIDQLVSKSGKTKELKDSVNKIIPKNSVEKKPLLIVVGKTEENLKRASSNLFRVNVVDAVNLNILNLLSSKYVIFDKEALKVIKKRFS